MAWEESIGGICSGLYLKYANIIPTVLIGQQGGFHVKTIRHYTLLFCPSLLLLLAATSAQAECIAYKWDISTAYVRGNTVSHLQHEWHAKRSSTGVIPGTHKPTWRDLGQCDSGEPPPPPPLR